MSEEPRAQSWTTLVYVLAALAMGVMNAVLSGVDLTTARGIGFACGLPIIGALVGGIANLFRRVNVGKAMCVASAYGLAMAGWRMLKLLAR